jgi:hypothetical protein
MKKIIKEIIAVITDFNFTAPTNFPNIYNN